eukprot:5653658-Ditylum_brightwellii.AAC.1
MNNTADLELNRYTGPQTTSRRHHHNSFLGGETNFFENSSWSENIGAVEENGNQPFDGITDNNTSDSLSDPLLSSHPKSDDNDGAEVEIHAGRIGGGGEGGGKASIIVSIFNLANNVAGSGMLTLSSGKASGSGTGWVPSVLLVFLLAYAACHTFTLIGKSCEITGSRTFRDLWIS